LSMPEAAAQMKAMGMDKMIAISRPDKKVTYLVYPGLNAYLEMPLKDADEAQNDEVIDDIEDAQSAFELLCYLDGLGSKEYESFGLVPGGGEESHKVVQFSLWDLDPTRRDDTYPY